MLKSLFHIPDTFDPDDRRRRQVLNTLLILFIVGDLAAESLTFLAYCKCTPFVFTDSGAEFFLIPGLWGLVICAGLMFTNRSPRVPVWLSGAIFMGLMIALFLESDAPYEVYNGRSTIMWAIPIMVGALRR